MAVRPALTTAMVTAISAKTGYGDVWLIEILGSSNTLRYTTSPQDVSYDSKTWTGIGGLIEIEAPPETTDPAGQSCRLNFSGVQQSIITEVLTNNVRGRTCNVYWGQVKILDGIVQVAPLLIFSGMMNSSWDIQETPGEAGTNHGTVRVGTTVVSDMSRYQYPRGVYTNQWSLRNMQKRAYHELTLQANPITTTSGSAVITVACTAEPQRVGVGDQVTLSSATDVGGILASRLNVQLTVATVPSHNSFTATLTGANATSSATGGGTPGAVYGHDISNIVALPDLFFNTLPDLINQPIFWGRKGAHVNAAKNAGYQNAGDLAAL